MTEIILRRITVQDVPALSHVAKKTFYDTFTGTCTADDMQVFLDEFYNEISLAEEINNSNYQYFFAEQNNEIIGYILFSENNTAFAEITGSKALELKRLYVLESFHGKGIAQIMMNFYIDYAVKNGYDLAFLGVWEHNLRAQKFYSKYGFVTSVYTHDFPIGNTPQTDIYMLKWI